jgi:hypothetical protein
MATNTSTQSLLDELASPTYATTAAVETTMLALLADLESPKTQSARYGTLVGLAIMAESDTNLVARMELYRQSALAMQDRLARMDALAQEVVGIFRQMDRYDAEIRPDAGAAGYTV